jgi:hypothetical protein
MQPSDEEDDDVPFTWRDLTVACHNTCCTGMGIAALLELRGEDLLRALDFMYRWVVNAYEYAWDGMTEEDRQGMVFPYSALWWLRQAALRCDRPDSELVAFSAVVDEAIDELERRLKAEGADAAQHP